MFQRKTQKCHDFSAYGLCFLIMVACASLYAACRKPSGTWTKLPPRIAICAKTSLQACWLSQNSQNKVIAILFLRSIFAGTSHHRSEQVDAFVAGAFSFDFAPGLFPAVFDLHVGFFPQFRGSGGHDFAARRVFFHEFSPKPQFCALCFIVSTVWRRLDNSFSSFSAPRREFSKSVFRPCFLKSQAGKTLVRFSASPLRLRAPREGEGG